MACLFSSLFNAFQVLANFFLEPLMWHALYVPFSQAELFMHWILCQNQKHPKDNASQAPSPIPSQARAPYALAPAKEPGEYTAAIVPRGTDSKGHEVCERTAAARAEEARQG